MYATGAPTTFDKTRHRRASRGTVPGVTRKPGGKPGHRNEGKPETKTMKLENRLTPHALFDTNVQLGSDDVISLTVTPDEAFVSVTTRRRGGDAVPADIFQGRTRQIVLTSLTGHRTARIADALALAATVDLDTYTAAIVTGFHDGVSGDRGDAIAAVEDIEHALYGLVGNEDIDFATNSGVSVWSADEWLQACDELEFLGKTDDAIIAEAECENIILLDVAEWRKDATARIITA